MDTRHALLVAFVLAADTLVWTGLHAAWKAR